jgi:hypothetical protein
MSMKSVLSIAIITMLVAIGCVPVQRHDGPDLMSLDKTPLVKGQTTEEQLIKRFGPSRGTNTSGDGTKSLSWVEVDMKGNVSYIPGLGDEKKATHRMLSATVRNGVLVDYNISDGETAYH